MKEFFTKFKGLTVTFLILLIAIPALAFRAFNGTTDLLLFDSIKCSTGLTCSREGGKLLMTSSPSISGSPLSITAANATDAIFNIISDHNDDNGDAWAIKALASGNSLSIQNNTSGSLAAKLAIGTDGVLTLVNLDTLSNATDDSLIFASEDSDSIFQVKGFEAKDATLQLWADEGDDAADKWSFVSDHSTNSLFVKNSTTTLMTISSAGAITGVGDAAFSGYLSKQVAATATTITASQCGSTFYNSGAVVINLPDGSAGLLGCRLTFFVANASNYDVNPGNSDQILTLTNAAGDAIRNATKGGSVVLQYGATNEWYVIGKEQGTWSDIN